MILLSVLVFLDSVLQTRRSKRPIAGPLSIPIPATNRPSHATFCFLQRSWDLALASTLISNLLSLGSRLAWLFPVRRNIVVHLAIDWSTILKYQELQSFRNLPTSFIFPRHIAFLPQVPVIIRVKKWTSRCIKKRQKMQAQASRSKCPRRSDSGPSFSTLQGQRQWDILQKRPFLPRSQ